MDPFDFSAAMPPSSGSVRRNVLWSDLLFGSFVVISGIVAIVLFAHG